VVAGGYVGWLWLRKDGGQATNEEVFTVERGNLVATVASTGEVYAPRKAELAFDVNRILLIELNVVPGQRVGEGDVLARIDPTILERAVAQAEADLTVAQDSLAKAQNPYTELDLIQARLAVSQTLVTLADAKANLEAVLNPDLDPARRKVRDTQASLKSAEEQLVLTQNDSDNAARLRTLGYELNWYQVNYWEAQQKFKEGKIDQQKLDWEYSNMLAAEERLRAAQVRAASSLTSAQSQVSKAREAYQEALADLAKLQEGPAPNDLARAQNQAVQAEYSWAKAQANLAEIEDGPAPRDVEVARAKVASAQADLEQAQAALLAATMTAPFAGTVVSLGAEVGDLVSSGTVVVTLADLSNLRVRAIVDETDITQVEIGQEASITFDALPGRRFSGQVLEVPLQGKLMQNILTYEVPVSLEGAIGETLKPGMTANLSIVVGRRENVLLAPAIAVKLGEDGSVVKVLDALQGSAFETRVVLGLSDGIYVEVKQGLNEGDRLLVEYATTQTAQPVGGGFPQQMMPAGGQRFR
jgi:RND family efflux transporter MFP subunit